VATQTAPPAPGFDWIRGTGLLAVMFLGVAIAYVFFLLLVFALVDGPIFPATNS
jgi:hypothetical protein